MHTLKNQKWCGYISIKNQTWKPEMLQEIKRESLNDRGSYNNLNFFHIYIYKYNVRLEKSNEI